LDRDEILQFETKHPVGSRARLALALLLYTGQRRSDVVRMGRQHFRDGVLQVQQVKTGAELMIPVHSTLVTIIAESTLSWQFERDDLGLMVSVEGIQLCSKSFRRCA
jgi:integrase